MTITPASPKWVQRLFLLVMTQDEWRRCTWARVGWRGVEAAFLVDPPCTVTMNGVTRMLFERKFHAWGSRGWRGVFS